MHPEICTLLDDTGMGLADGHGCLSERERRLVAGAADFHSFTHPGRTIRFTVLRGPRGTLPSLTDQQCRSIEWDHDREVVGCCVLRSKVAPAERSDPAAPIELTVGVGGGAGTGTGYDELPGPLGALRRAVRFRAPIHFDAVRQLRTDLAEARYRTVPVARHAPVRIGRAAAAAALAAAPAAAAPGTRPAVLFGLHWLELGGAERWALHAVRLARDAGLLPIVFTDRASTQPWITRPELDGAVVVPLTQPLEPGMAARLLDGVLSAFDVRGIHIHHCEWLYARLPWIKARRPDIPVLDSLHIMEWRTGGFVDIAVRMSAVIDVHHVISPQLRDHLITKQGIEPDKIGLASLAHLADRDRMAIDPASSRADGQAGNEPFTVAFVGRFTQQKRPYLFLKLAHELAAGGTPMRFVMHGDGELADEVRALRSKLGLTGLVELRGTDVPVSATLAVADVLVVSSDNEGLALTTFEANRAGVPVVSTDVGSQSALVADGLLCPRHPYRFLRVAADRVRVLARSDEQRKIWLAEQLAKADRFAELPDAETWTRARYEGWRR